MKLGDLFTLETERRVPWTNKDTGVEGEYILPPGMYQIESFGNHPDVTIHSCDKYLAASVPYSFFESVQWQS